MSNWLAIVLCVACIGAGVAAVFVLGSLLWPRANHRDGDKGLEYPERTREGR